MALLHQATDALNCVLAAYVSGRCDVSEIPAHERRGKDGALLRLPERCTPRFLFVVTAARFDNHLPTLQIDAGGREWVHPRRRVQGAFGSIEHGGSRIVS